MKTPTPILLALAAALTIQNTATGQRPPPMPQAPTVKSRPLGPPPTGLQISFANPGVVLVWGAVADPAGYRVYRTGDPAAGPIELTTAPITELKFVDLTAAPGAIYSYSVSADYTDQRIGPSTPVAFGVPMLTRSGQWVSPPMASTPMDLPVGALTGLQIGANPIEVALSWTGSPGAKYYEVRRTEPYQGTTLVTPAGGGYTESTFRDRGVAPRTFYQYEVTAVGGRGDRTSANAAINTPWLSKATGLTASTQLNNVHTQITPTRNVLLTVNGTVSLSWEPVPGATGYRVTGPGLTSFRQVAGTTTTIGPVPTGHSKYMVLAEFINGQGRRFALDNDPAELTLTVGPPPASGFGPTQPREGSGTFEWSHTETTAGVYLLVADRPGGPYREVPGGVIPPYGGRHHEIPDTGRTFWYKVLTNYATGPSAVTDPPLRLIRRGQFRITGLEILSNQAGNVRFRWHPIGHATYVVEPLGKPPATLPFADGLNAEFADPYTTAGKSYGYKVCATAVPFGAVYPETRCGQITVAVP